jgi:phenylacetate-CoA ligase
VFQPFEGGLVRVLDPVTRAAFFFEDVQATVLRELDGRAAAEIAAAVLEDPDAAPVVASFGERCRALGLTTDDDVASRSARQRATMRGESEAKRDALLAQLLSWARRTIPFYRQRLTGIPEVRRARDLEHLPLMGKRDLREHFAQLMPDGIDVLALSQGNEALVTATSGTTGERLQCVLDLKAPSYLPTHPGLEPIPGGLAAARTVVFTTPICSGTVCHMGGMRYEERLTSHTLVLNSSDRVMRLTRGELESIVEDCERYRPTILQCDPVYALALVRALEREKLPLPRVAVVWTTYEYCSRLHHDALERAFGVPVFNVYGATEAGGGQSLFECERGTHHVREDAFVVELLRDGRPVDEGALGELTVTTLRHRFMPLVRYSSGDLARALPGCDCSHAHLPAVRLEGRLKDCLPTADGRIVTTYEVDEQFAGVDFLDFYRLEQRGADQYDLLGVLRPGADTVGAVPLLERLGALLRAKVRTRWVREIPAEKSLKYRLTVPAPAMELSSW